MRNEHHPETEQQKTIPTGPISPLKRLSLWVNGDETSPCEPVTPGTVPPEDLQRSKKTFLQRIKHFRVFYAIASVVICCFLIG